MTVVQRLPRTAFVCEECGYETPKWLGRCPDCSSWNTLAERSARRGSRNGATPSAPPVELSRLAHEDSPRLAFGLPEFDRVLGGGAVAGSLALIGGDPGIGKSTLLLQVAAQAAGNQPARPEPGRRACTEPAVGAGASACPQRNRRVLYLAGEESAQQVRLRAARLGLAGDGLFVLTETSLETALQQAESLSPGLLIVDSIQTVYAESTPQAPGSVAQLRACTLELMRWAKGGGVPAFIVGHVTKDGDIAGPKLLEHIVDVVLYLEGERFSNYRLLRSAKNRFGSTDEIGVFEMTGEGMTGVDNPSQAFIAERARDAVGSAIVPTLEGSRPLLVEVQALTSPTATPSPRRTVNGLDFNRLLLVTAVLTRRVGLSLAAQDLVASVVGGLRVQEPAADLGLALAIASSHRGRPVSPDLVALGEVGLSGELRSVSHLERRLAEAERLGFRRCLLPRSALARPGSNGARLRTGLELLPADTLAEAIRLGLGQG